MNTLTQRCLPLLALACLSLVGCGSGSDNNSGAANQTAPGMTVQTQSSYAKGNQPLSAVVNQVQQNYQTQLQTGQQP